MSDVSSPGSLAGRKVLVAGATGGIGEGITSALLALGATVIATGRSSERLEALRSRAPVPHDEPCALVLETTDVARADSVAVTNELGIAHGPLDGVVITIGNWGPPGRAGILDTSDETWDLMIADNLTSHFRALRALTPLLDEGGALVHLSGYSAEIPYPHAALVGATNAAKKSLVRSLTAELAGRGPRVYELIIGPIRTRPRAAAGADDRRWLGAEDLGRHVGGLIAGSSELTDEPLQYLLDLASGARSAPPR